jgi:hypothetical protein
VEGKVGTHSQGESGLSVGCHSPGGCRLSYVDCAGYVCYVGRTQLSSRGVFYHTPY